MASPIEDSERVLQGDSSEAKGCCARFKPTRKIFTKYVLLRVLGLSLYVFDMLTDISVAYTDYKAGDFIFSYITIGLVFAPGVLFSFYLFCEYFLLYIGEISCLKALLWVLSSPFLPVWVILRDIKQIIEGIIATLIPVKRYKIIEKLNQPSRAYLLKFLEAFTEAAPQLVVRLYRIATRSPQQFSDIRTTEAVQISLSLLILSLKVVSTHQRSVSTKNVIEGHNEPHSEQTLPSYLQIVALIWWMCFLITRFQALALFSASYDLWVLLVIGIHVLLIFLFQTIADYQNIMKRIFIYLFGAFVFIFAYIQFNMHTRMKIAVWFPYTIYAILLFVENSIMMTFWYFDQRKQIELLNSTIIITNKPRPILGAKTTSLPNNVGAVPSVADLQYHSKLLLFLHYGIFGVGLLFMIILFTCAAICNKNQDTEDRKKQEPIEMQTLMTG